VEETGEVVLQEKDHHIEVCLAWDVEGGRTTGLERFALQGHLPDFVPSDMDLSYEFLGKTLSLPLLIAPITGGGSKSTRINKTLAEAAEQCGIAMAFGSQRPMMEGRADRASYTVRDVAPTIPLLGNLGLMHVKKGRDYVLEAVESVNADGIVFYVNPLHEVLQAHGDKDFKGCLDTLAAIAEDLPYPVFLKEVGFGLSRDVIEWASRTAVAGVDVAGAGGTNWACIEGLVQGKDYSVYEGLGMCTSDVISLASSTLRSDQRLVASGGVRTGIDMAKCFAMGSHMVSMALPFLRWADRGVDEVIRAVDHLKGQLEVCMWYCGSRNVSGLKGRIVRDSA
jgi:isopentenyl-diphosphate Delta-isomerase